MTMSMIDLSTYNLGELKGLQYDIEKEIKSRQLHEVSKAREQILVIAQELGVFIGRFTRRRGKETQSWPG